MGVLKHTMESRKKMSESRKRFYKNGGHSSFFGKPHTDKIKRKIAESRMGEKNWAKRPDVRKKISEARARDGIFKGEKNPNWKDGCSKMTIRKKVLIRDNFTCRDCGLRDEIIMDVDHDKPKRAFRELIRKIENLITLCPNCHKRKTLKDRVLYPQRTNNQHTITK